MIALAAVGISHTLLMVFVLCSTPSVSKNPCSNTSSELVFERWILVHGPMKTLYVDGGPEFKGQLEALCRLYAVHLEVLPVGYKWKAGLAERHGAVLKLMILRMIHELSLCTDKELRFAVAMACQAKNRLLRKCGRSPIQVTQGQDQGDSIVVVATSNRWRHEV